MTSASLRLRVIQGERSLSFEAEKTTRPENGKKRQAPLQTSDTYELMPMPINCHPVNERDHRRWKGMRVTASF